MLIIHNQTVGISFFGAAAAMNNSALINVSNNSNNNSTNNNNNNNNGTTNQPGALWQPAIPHKGINSIATKCKFKMIPLLFLSYE